MTDIEKENQDSLFIKFQDISTGTWIVNKRHIVSAGISTGNVTRIVLTSGAIIDSYYPFGKLEKYLHHVGHNTGNPDDSEQKKE